MAYADETHRQLYITKIRQELTARGQSHIWPPGTIERMSMRQLASMFQVPTVYAIQPPPAP